LAAAIQQATGLDAKLVKGDGGVFDVRVDGRLIFSKKKEGRYPTNEEIVAQLR
jgi:selT/selW/selH-like putative selenoprotein